jgi:glutaredoxin
MSQQKKAILYRMVMKKHLCPFGLKSLDLLKRKGYEVEDNHITTREQQEDIKDKFDVKTTPQTFIDGKRIGGYDDLRDFFDMPPAKPQGKTYTPVLVVFAVTFLMALASLFASNQHDIIGRFAFMSLIEIFVAFSMCALAILKFRDMFSFTNRFIGYDIVGQRYVPYAYLYPYAECFVGLGMIASIASLTPIVAITALIIGSIGSISVIKAVYIEKRDLKCACVGGDMDVPLGALSLTENLMMVTMGIWMLIKPLF